MTNQLTVSAAFAENEERYAYPDEDNLGLLVGGIVATAATVRNKEQ